MQKLLKQDRETGNLAPKVRTKQTPTKLSPEQLIVLQELVNSKKDATLEELRCQFALITGVVIGRSTVDRMLHRLNLSVKKNFKCHRKRNGESAA